MELSTGECVEAGLIQAPDREWVGILKSLILESTVEPWTWAAQHVLRFDTGAEVWCYILHRDGVPFATNMSIEHRGVAMRGYLWTRPSERRQGASARLMDLQMDDFRARGVRAIHHFTDYASVPYRLYRKYGFESVEPLSGHMAYHSVPPDQFEGSYFEQDETGVETFDWVHFAPAHPLFMGDYPELLRIAPLRLVGRWSPEMPLLRLLKNETKRRATGDWPRAKVLRNPTTGAVSGFATWTWQSGDPSTCLADVYCHPKSWNWAGALFEALELPDARRVVVYAESGGEDKIRFLHEAGFRQVDCFRGVPAQWCRPGIGYLPKTRAGTRLARLASPTVMALRKTRSRQGGMTSSNPASMDLLLFERR